MFPWPWALPTADVAGGGKGVFVAANAGDGVAGVIVASAVVAGGWVAVQAATMTAVAIIKDAMLNRFLSFILSPLCYVVNCVAWAIVTQEYGEVMEGYFPLLENNGFRSGATHFVSASHLY